MQRAFSTTSAAARRLRADLPLRPAVVPTVESLPTLDSHPLWQFFSNKRFVRNQAEVDPAAGRPWSIPELRRKLFDDLHALWYVCVRERNVLSREYHVAEVDGFETSHLVQQLDKVYETMWRIRAVLGERNAAWKYARGHWEKEKAGYLREFAEEYVEEGDDGKLGRLQEAVFGLGQLDQVTRGVVEGVKYVGGLKAKRWEKVSGVEVGELRGVEEAHAFFEMEGEAAWEKVKAWREEGREVVGLGEEVAVVGELLGMK